MYDDARTRTGLSNNLELVITAIQQQGIAKKKLMVYQWIKKSPQR
jgi:hypothetical protein